MNSGLYLLEYKSALKVHLVCSLKYKVYDKVFSNLSGNCIRYLIFPQNGLFTNVAGYESWNDKTQS